MRIVLDQFTIERPDDKKRFTYVLQKNGGQDFRIRIERGGSNVSILCNSTKEAQIREVFEKIRSKNESFIIGKKKKMSNHDKAFQAVSKKHMEKIKNIHANLLLSLVKGDLNAADTASIFAMGYEQALNDNEKNR